MFLRTINHCTDWLATVFDEADDPRHYRATRWSSLFAASLALAAAVVTLTTVIALGLDALLHAQLSVNLPH